MRRQKRFTSEKEIISAIDACYEESTRLQAFAENLDEMATLKFKDAAHPDCTSKTFLTEQAQEFRKKAQKTRKRASGMIDIKAKKLGRTLAAFRTSTLMVGDDTAVVLAP